MNKLAITDRDRVPHRAILKAMETGRLVEAEVPKVLELAESFYLSMQMIGTVHNKRSRRVGWRKARTLALEEYLFYRK